MNDLPACAEEWNTVAYDMNWMKWVALIGVVGTLTYLFILACDVLLLEERMAWWKIAVCLAGMALTAIAICLMRFYVNTYAGVWGTYTVYRQGKDEKWRKNVYLLDKSLAVIMAVRRSVHALGFCHKVWRCPRPFEARVFLGYLPLGNLSVPRVATCGFLADEISDAELIRCYPGGECDAKKALSEVLASTVDRQGRPEITYHFDLQPEDVAPWLQTGSALVEYDTAAEAATAVASPG